MLKKYRLEVINFVVGASVLTFELTASRMVAPYIGTSIYVWTSIIGVILGSLAIGYMFGGRLADKRHNPSDVSLLLVIAAAIMLLTNAVKDPVLKLITAANLSPESQALVAGLALFVVPTFVLGMIVPYLVRLNIVDVASSGRKAASIDSWGTIGSLFGTFITGYVLFGFIGTRNLLGLIAIVLVLASFLMSRRPYLGQQFAVLVVAIVMMAGPPGLFISNIVKDVDTRYSRIMVRDINYGGKPVRALQMDQYYIQSGIFRNNSTELVTNYGRGFAAVAAQRPQASDVLVVGGGAFTFPMYLQERTSAMVDVVEIDGQLRDISEEFFDLKPNERMRIIATDGRQYLNTTQKRYDMIFIDAYSSGDPPFQLFTAEAITQMKRALKPGGVVAVNAISPASEPATPLIGSVMATYQQVFGHVQVFRANASLPATLNQNLILVAKIDSSPLEPGLQQLNIEGSGMVFTDDFAPIERFVIR